MAAPQGQRTGGPRRFGTSHIISAVPYIDHIGAVRLALFQICFHGIRIRLVARAVIRTDHSIEITGQAKRHEFTLILFSGFGSDDAGPGALIFQTLKAFQDPVKYMYQMPVVRYIGIPQLYSRLQICDAQLLYRILAGYAECEAQLFRGRI